jgi:Glycolipid 2-alpha-mannosyltransferase
MGTRAATDNADRLAVMIISENRELLCCALKNIRENAMANTPSDIFVFSPTTAQEDYVRVHCGSSLENTYFLQLNQSEHWTIPTEAGPQETWTNREYTIPYRKMGHWRLAFQFKFAAALGYKYMLQVDDDSWFPEPMSLNHITYMQQQHLHITARTISHDNVKIFSSLPELTRYHLVSKGIEPLLLYDYCTPQNISGLYSDHTDSGDSGYDGTLLYGNFILFSLDFWFRADVQQYLELIFQSGGHFRHRWNEQEIIGMIWLMFCSKQEYHIFDFPYEHGIKHRTC